MDEEKFTIKEYVLYKLDRTLAVVGLIVLGCWSLVELTPETSQIAIAVVGGLVGYVGGRSGKA
jgi:ribosome biogenesis SPOUT family RNA methylase Rps3